MTTADSGALPAPHSSDSDPVVVAGLEIATKWGSALVGADKLDVALKALEPEPRRHHKERMARLDMQREAAQHAVAERREERAHLRHIAGLIVGGVVAVALLGAGVYVVKDAWWLSLLLCGPSLLALAKVFVLRRSDADGMKAVTQGLAPRPMPPSRRSSSLYRPWSDGRPVNA